MDHLLNILKISGNLLKESFLAWQEDKASRLAAALAYYTVFAMAPLLIIAVAVVSLVLSEQAAQNEIATLLEDTVGQQAAALIEGAITNASQPAASILASLIGFGTLLFAASGLFGQLQDALNTAWQAESQLEGGLVYFIKSRLLMFVMVFLIGGLLLLSLVASIIVSAVTEYLQLGSYLQNINLLVSFGLVTLLFALIYQILPETDISWGDVWIGATVTSILFTLGKYLIGLYLGSSNVGSAYGAAGSLLVILVWIYYSAQIFLFGAEFTHVYAQKFGSLAKPAADSALPKQSPADIPPAEPEVRPPEKSLASPVKPKMKQPEITTAAVAILGLMIGVIVGKAWRSD